MNLEIQVTEKDKERMKVIKKVINGSKDEECIKLSQYFFGEQQKDIVKKLKKKAVGEYIINGRHVEYFHLQNIYAMDRVKKERERAWKYLNDKKEAEKYGFVDENEYKLMGKKLPKQNDNQIKTWADKAYPNINLAEYENDFNKSLISLSIV